MVCAGLNCREVGTTELPNYGRALRRRCAPIRPLTRATQMGADWQ